MQLTVEEHKRIFEIKARMRGNKVERAHRYNEDVDFLIELLFKVIDTSNKVAEQHDSSLLIEDLLALISKHNLAYKLQPHA